MSMNDLLAKKEQLQKDLEQVERDIVKQKRIDRPYVAGICSTAGDFATRFATETQARKKYEQYRAKENFRTGINWGVSLYRLNADGTKTLLDEAPVMHKTFTTGTHTRFLEPDTL